LVAYDDGNGEDQSNSAKVQFMITNKMKATLKDELGYLPEEVRYCRCSWKVILKPFDLLNIYSLFWVHLPG